MTTETWVAIDTVTSRIVDFGFQGEVQLSANKHTELSGNPVVIRKLKTGMVLRGWE